MLEVLESIRRPILKRRFLQSWDPERRVLRYGCGDEDQAVIIGSDTPLDRSDEARGTKLGASTVKAFLEGSSPESPLAAVKALLKEYVYLPDERLYSLFATWIAGTYVYSMFSHFGYLFLYSGKPRCGKTRAEEVVSHLAFEATEPRNAPTPPSMRETAVAGGTVVFDTLERWKDKSTESYAAAMELLDAGFRRAGAVTKMVPGRDSEWRQEVYPVYAPYMLAAIDYKSLTDTARDRSFQVEMTRKRTRVRTKPYDGRCEKACDPIRENLYLFSLANATQISDIYESRDLQDYVDALGLNDRAADIWKPLLAVTKVMDGPGIDALANLAVEMSPNLDRQEELRQLRIASALRTLAGPGGTLTGTTQQVIERLLTVTQVDVPDLHSVLSEWGVQEKSIRLPAVDTPRKAWEVTDAELASIEAILKGEGPIPSEDATTTTTGVWPSVPSAC